MVDKKKDSPAASAFATIVVGIGFVWALHSCSVQKDKMDAERDQAAAQLDASDHAEAKRLGMSYEDYRSARWASDKAYAACKVAAEGRAKRDYKADFIPSSSWSVHGRIISIVGHDLRMQNGFGAYDPVTYMCDWSMDSQAVTSLDVTQD